VLLNNVMLVNGSRPVNIAVSSGKIRAMETGLPGNTTGDFHIHFTDALAIPGLINSHDHLDFNCFSIIGEKKYNNYKEWGKHIHESSREQIHAILKIPKNYRVLWGMYKNLLAGITTVVNHGHYLKIKNPLINIYQEPQNLHSVQFEKKWKWKLNNPLLKNRDCVIHAGEGVDTQSRHEIDDLIKYNLLKRNLIGVHGVAMTPAQAKNFKGLVWCPESNQVLLNKQADIEQLKAHTTLVFGTDSTLTGNWNIWQHLRLARSLHKLNDAELFGTVTSAPAGLWNLNNGFLKSDKDADIVIVRNSYGAPTWDTVFKIDPEDILIVIHQGHIRMFDKIMLSQLGSLPVNISGFSQVNLQGNIKFVEGDLPDLVAAIRSYNKQVAFPFAASESIVSSAY
jgi:cytosine/adenosine deaminase-related metal-dependent hydrolase